MITLKLKRVSARVQLSNGKMICKSSVNARKIFAFLHSLNNSDIWEIYVKVTYHDESEPQRNDFKNEGVYLNTKDAINALKAFVEVTK